MKSYTLLLKIKRYYAEDHGLKPMKAEYFHIIEEVFREQKPVMSGAMIRTKRKTMKYLQQFYKSLEPPREK